MKHYFTLITKLLTIWYIVAVLIELVFPGYVSSSINLSYWLVLVVILLGIHLLFQRSSSTHTK